MLARDLQSIVLYDQEGKFVGVRRPSSKLPIDVDGTKIVIVDAIGSSGLDLKVMTQKITLVLNNMGFSLTA
jgi:cytochrome c biogenesis protein